MPRIVAINSRSAADRTNEAQRVAMEPLTVLPCQFAHDGFRATRLCPQARLQLAVLEDAVLTVNRCAGKAAARPRRLLGEVEAWIESDSDEGPFAFLAICQSLGLDADYIRAGLRRWSTRLEIAQRDTVPLRRARGGCGICLPSGRAVA